jgi:hypothetical protein
MSEPQITWGAGLTPEELAARLAAHPFAAVREPLMQRIVLAVLGRAQKAAPVRTGHLRRSLTTRVEPGGLRGFVGSNVVYAPFVHARVPFLAQGVDDSRAQIAKLLQDAGDDYLQGLV